MWVRCQNSNCRRDFEAQRKTAKFCGDLCRTQARRARVKAQRPVKRDYQAEYRHQLELTGEAQERAARLFVENEQLRADRGLVDKSLREKMSAWDDAQSRQFVKLVARNGNAQQAARWVVENRLQDRE